MGWEEVTPQEIAASTPGVEFTGLGDYSELYVMQDGGDASGATLAELLLSDDDGDTFYETNGNYQETAPNGAQSDRHFIESYENASALARSAAWWIGLWNVAAKKPVMPLNGNRANIGAYTFNVAVACNALRIQTTNSLQDWDAGTFRVFGLTEGSSGDELTGISEIVGNGIRLSVIQSATRLVGSGLDLDVERDGDGIITAVAGSGIRLTVDRTSGVVLRGNGLALTASLDENGALSTLAGNGLRLTALS